MSFPERLNSIADDLVSGRLDLAADRLQQTADLASTSAEWQVLAGVLLSRRGQAASALAHFEAALRLDPRHAHAWNNRGVLLRSLKRPGEAEDCHRRALELQPESSDFQRNHGACLQDLGRHAEAEALFARLARAQPNDPQVHFSRGISLTALKRTSESVECYRRTLQLQPNHWAAALNLAVILAAEGQTEEAERLYRSAYALHPGEALIPYNLSNLLADRGASEEVERLLRETLRLRPTFVEAWINLGNYLRQRHRIEEAVAALQKAAALDPNSPYPINALGVIHRERRNVVEAEKCYREAIRRKPNFAPALTNLGHSLRRGGHLAEAEDCYRRAIDSNPKESESHNGLGLLCADEGRHQEAVDSLRRALAINPSSASHHSNLLFILSHQSLRTAAEVLQDARQWERRLPPFSRLPPRKPRSGRLRIGYVSADFRKHAISYFIGPVLAAHDPSRVEVFCYAQVPTPDPRTEQLRALVPHWHFIHTLDDNAAARLIREHEIDVLIDLSGHTQGHRLGVFARKPAPVQATWLGYFASTGLSAMDYWITDTVLHPTPTSEPASETIWRLPRCWVSYQAPVDAPEPSASRSSEVTFGSFNNLAKLSVAAIDLWAPVLNQVPGSRLFLKNAKLADTRTCERISRAFAERGVTSDRLRFGVHSPSLTEHLAAYADVDVALDPFPYTGGTTTADALWMGVPTVTLPGSTHPSRMSASMLTAAGFPEWIASSPEDFVLKAKTLAASWQALSSEDRLALRLARRARMAQSELGNASSLARCLEDAYLAMAARAGPAAFGG